MIAIKLSNGGESLVDDSDIHLSFYKWNKSQRGYAVRYQRFDGRIIATYLHHAVIGKPLNKKQVDHLNGDRLDNRKSNLKIVSCRENLQNSFVNRKRGFVGIRKDRNRWRAQIMVKKKKINLGSYVTPEKAQEAYLNFCKEIEK